MIRYWGGKKNNFNKMQLNIIESNTYTHRSTSEKRCSLWMNGRISNILSNTSDTSRGWRGTSAPNAQVHCRSNKKKLFLSVMRLEFHIFFERRYTNFLKMMYSTYSVKIYVGEPIQDIISDKGAIHTIPRFWWSMHLVQCH